MPQQAVNSMPIEALMVLLAIVGLFIGGATLILTGARARREALAKRVERVQGRSVTAASKDGKGDRALGDRRTLQSVQGVTEAEQRQIIRMLARLGVPAERAFSTFKTAKLVLVLCAAAGTYAAVQFIMGKPPGISALAAAMAAALGWLLPMMMVRSGITRHRKSVGKGLPDALELLAVCVEAGLSLENALQRVVQELKMSHPSLSEEMSMTWAEINILPSREQALLNLAERVDLQSVRSVVGTLCQTLKYGTPLARSLRVVAADVRNDQLTAMEEKANRLPAMMTVPVMLFVLPTIFLIVGGPAALKLMDMFAK
jgi:tight adherence protein C